MTFAAALALFLEARRIDRGAAAATLEAYHQDLRQFGETLAAKSETPVAAITDADLHAYLKSLHRDRAKSASVSRKISSLRQFFKFGMLELGLAVNPADRLRSPARSQRLPKFLSHASVEKLLVATAQGLPYPESIRRELVLRDQAMVILLYATGLRVSELVGLSTHAVDLTLSYVRVLGKGGKERIVPFADAARDALDEYLAGGRPELVRNALEKGVQTDALFVSRRGAGLTRQAFWGTLNDLASLARIDEEISPHRLRHSFATHLLQAGMNLRSLQTLLGHSDLSTTQIYAGVTPEHLKELHRKYHPRGGG